jgi:hypothetical protein
MKEFILIIFIGAMSVPDDGKEKCVWSATCIVISIFYSLAKRAFSSFLAEAP